MIFRFDDIGSNTDFDNYHNIIKLLKERYPDCSIVSAVNVLSQDNAKLTGQVYDGDAPFKNNPIDWFYGVNSYFSDWREKTVGKVASHGLLHLDHSKASKQIQEMSILTSCSILESTVFLPPFNRFNEDTVKICRDNMIKLLGHQENWKCFEFNKFDDLFQLWYLHSWRWTPEKLERALDGNSIELGQLQTNNDVNDGVAQAKACA